MAKTTKPASKAKIIITYFSRTLHTQHMAEAITEGARRVKRVEVDLRPLREIEMASLLDYDAILIGSPTYYGTMAAEVKMFFDESIAFHGRLEGKVGGAFSSSANIGGGNETTIMDILRAMLVHGMVVRGSVSGDHYGPVSIGEMDTRSRLQCLHYGENAAKLTLKLHG